ncbi:MAG: mechanosensitive ion channel family protein [Chloroflexota bacterium]
MPTTAAADPLAWVQSTWFILVVAILVAALLWRLSRPVSRRVVTALLRAQGVALGGRLAADEVAKRAATVEQLIAGCVRFAIGCAVVIAVLGAFDLWSAIAALGVIGAALAFAGQAVVLDLLMGALILLESQYATGDTVRIGEVEGEVEEIGLRRTTLRDATGTVHVISNGMIRSVANLTRVHAMAIVDIPRVPEVAIADTIAIMDRVGAELAADPAWADAILVPPAYLATTELEAEGVTLRIAGRVRAADRWRVTAELRHRLALALHVARAAVAEDGRTGGGGAETGDGAHR